MSENIRKALQAYRAALVAGDCEDIAQENGIDAADLTEREIDAFIDAVADDQERRKPYNK